MTIVLMFWLVRDIRFASKVPKSRVLLRRSLLTTILLIAKSAIVHSSQDVKKMSLKTAAKMLLSMTFLVIQLGLTNAQTSNQPQNREYSLSNALSLVQNSQQNERQIPEPWWKTMASQAIDPSARRIEIDLQRVVQLAIANSAKVSVARHVPLIRETAISEANANFDWTSYFEGMWNDTSDPVGSALTVGGTGNRFRDHQLNSNSGFRRKFQTGGSIDVGTQSGWQNNNSQFFQPNNQASSRLVVGFTQPLLRGRGSYYNTSLIMLADVDVQSAKQEFSRQLQSHLLEVVNAYWSLYLERASLAQRIKLYKRTKSLYDKLVSRQELDAARSQVISARAAMKAREADLIRAVAAVRNGETRLRALINAPELGESTQGHEIAPVEHPMVNALPLDLQAEFTTAMKYRPELKSAMNSIKAASIRYDMTKHEILPQLNLVTQGYVAGLRGNNEFGNAFLDQFREGEPSYTVGLQWEMPIGRRAAYARNQRREVELSQMQEEYRNSLELIKADVEVAVREVATAYMELAAKNEARVAADQEAIALEERWKAQVDGVSGALSLESLLRAQERVREAEYEFALAQLTYNLSLVNLRHANGTLLTFVDEKGVSHSSNVNPRAQMQRTVTPQTIQTNRSITSPNERVQSAPAPMNQAPTTQTRHPVRDNSTLFADEVVKMRAIDMPTMPVVDSTLQSAASSAEDEPELANVRATVEDERAAKDAIEEEIKRIKSEQMKSPGTSASSVPYGKMSTAPAIGRPGKIAPKRVEKKSPELKQSSQIKQSPQFDESQPPETLGPPQKRLSNQELNPISNDLFNAPFDPSWQTPVEEGLPPTTRNDSWPVPNSLRMTGRPSNVQVAKENKFKSRGGVPADQSPAVRIEKPVKPYRIATGWFDDLQYGKWIR